MCDVSVTTDCELLAYQRVQAHETKAFKMSYILAQKGYVQKNSLQSDDSYIV